VHDCFSVTELVTMEDLYISPEGRPPLADVLDGFLRRRRHAPLARSTAASNAFGHPIGRLGAAQ